MFSAKNDATSSSPVNEVPEEDKSSDDERVINRCESFMRMKIQIYLKMILPR